MAAFLLYLLHKNRLIPELVKKKQARDADLKKKSDEMRQKRKVERQKKKAEIIAKSEKWYKEYLEERKKVIAAKREAKLAGNYYVPAEPKVAFVVRIRGYDGLLNVCLLGMRLPYWSGYVPNYFSCCVNLHKLVSIQSIPSQEKCSLF